MFRLLAIIQCSNIYKFYNIFLNDKDKITVFTPWPTHKKPTFYTSVGLENRCAFNVYGYF